jgi:quinol monooxygenase YgiN
MIAVIARIPVKEEKLNEAVEAFKQLMTEVAKEEGNLYYTLNVSKSDPHTLVVMERYKDKEALAAHSATPHFKAFSAKGAELFAGKPEITVLNELASV